MIFCLLNNKLVLFQSLIVYFDGVSLSLISIRACEYFIIIQLKFTQFLLGASIRMYIELSQSHHGYLMILVYSLCVLSSNLAFICR